MYVCAWVLYICTPYVQMPVKPEEVTRSLEAGGSCELEYGNLTQGPLQTQQVLLHSKPFQQLRHSLSTGIY